jgi:hypothetical protein
MFSVLAPIYSGTRAPKIRERPTKYSGVHVVLAMQGIRTPSMLALKEDERMKLGGFN